MQQEFEQVLAGNQGRIKYIASRYSQPHDFDDLYQGQVNKFILRDSFQGLLPESILQRKKTSLDVGSGIRSMVVEYLTKNGLVKTCVTLELSQLQKD